MIFSAFLSGRVVKCDLAMFLLKFWFLSEESYSYSILLENSCETGDFP